MFLTMPAAPVARRSAPFPVAAFRAGALPLCGRLRRLRLHGSQAADDTHREAFDLSVCRSRREKRDNG